MDPLRDLKRIFSAGVERVDPFRMILDRVSLNNNSLRVRSDRSEHLFDLTKFSSVIVLGAGKATAKMAQSLEEILGERITEGLISVKRGHTEKLSVIRMIESGHPVPDEMSVRAAEDILSLARKADEKTLVILLISGGGSALLCSPYHDGRFGPFVRREAGSDASSPLFRG
jgi:hydroxypyruvate reductase